MGDLTEYRFTFESDGTSVSSVDKVITDETYEDHIRFKVILTLKQSGNYIIGITLYDDESSISGSPFSVYISTAAADLQMSSNNLSDCFTPSLEAGKACYIGINALDEYNNPTVVDSLSMTIELEGVIDLP